jgi:hypothetical protein
MTATKQTVKAGDQIHFLRTGFTYPRVRGAHVESEVSRRGETLVISAEDLEVGKDRNGASWLDLVHDPDLQIARYGTVQVAPGAAPEGMRPWIVGDPDAEVERDRRRRIAFANADDEIRNTELRRIEQEFGPRPDANSIVFYRG